MTTSREFPAKPKTHGAAAAGVSAAGASAAAVPAGRPLLGTPPDRISGWVAVSATALNSADRPRLTWLRSYCPVAVLAGSILVFRFAAPPTAGPAPARPAPVCAGLWSSRPGQPGQPGQH